ncbi:MAG: ABC transporter permease, partial [Lachnospiraceae bacterium]|nr:ABC transporter permease [Lachnospiraceae bacterium]
TMYPAVESAFPSGTLDYDAITEYLEQGGYPVTGKAQGELYLLEPEYPAYQEPGGRDLPVLAVTLSVYNELRALSGLAPIGLAADEYGVAWDNEALESDIRNLTQKVRTIQAGTAELSKAEGADYQDPVGISLFTCQMASVYIIPDDAAQGLRTATTFYSANTARPLSYEFARKFEQEMGDYQRNLGNFPPESAFVRLNTLQTNEGTSTMLMLSLIGAYAALVLLISSFTMLSVQQLTDAIEQKRRFGIIGKLGVEPEEINRNIRQQMYFWFGLPVLTALISSAGVLAYLIWSSYRTIVAYISLAQIGFIFAGVYIVFLLILGCYFTATYISVCASVLQ